jgi:inorganic pyrophosphatase
LKASRTRKKNKQRNDRIVGVEEENHNYGHIKHVRDLGKKFVQELEEFFVNYHRHFGKKYRILDVKGPTEAWRRIEDGRKAFRRKA